MADMGKKTADGAFESTNPADGANIDGCKSAEAANETDPTEQIIEQIIEETTATQSAEQSIETDADKYDQLMDKYKRTMADYDNFRKRTAKEKTGMYQNGLCHAVEKMLPVLDNFERAVLSAVNKDDSFYKGIEMILKQFEGVLSEMGVKPIPAAGEPFDHNVHYAVAHVEDDSQGENVVVEELQKGYRLDDRIIRPSMVKVAN